jgi:membrane fusion protein (multidrug efflux system)
MSASEEEKRPVTDQGTPPVVRNGGRRKAMGYTLLFFALCALVAFAVWWFVFRGHETTDDAYVGGNLVYITSRQEGTVTAFYADDTDIVEEGQLLVSLDPTDYLTDLEQKKAALEVAVRQVAALYHNVKQAESEVESRQALYTRAQQDYQNRTGLVDAQAISREEFEHAGADLKDAKAALDLMRHKLISARAALGTTPLEEHPLILKAKSDAKEAYLKLGRSNIYAPIRGYIAKRSVQAGEWIKTSTPLMAVIPLDHVWVDANFKETQLSRMRIGQRADVTADMYGGSVLFTGIVKGIQGGSGSVFSLLPPQNASGNWIKIVQRVPVRILLKPDDLKEHPLFLGLSVYVKVYVDEDTGPILAQEPHVEPVMKTTIYDDALQGSGAIFDELVRRNLVFELDSNKLN